MIKYDVEKENVGTRLDLYLLKKIPLSRSQIKREISENRIFVNDRVLKAGYKIQQGDVISWDKKEPFTLKPQPMDLEFIYRDSDIAIINKQPDLVVHPGAGEEEESLVSGLLYHFENLPFDSDPLRPGIVHRLDKDTSGLMVVALSQAAYKELILSFQEREIHKTYLAIVQGKVEEGGTIRNPIGRSHKNRKKMAIDVFPSKEAISHYKPIEIFGENTLMEVDIETGRTHQIRVHMSSLNHPIIGDEMYGYRGKYRGRQLLHSYRLSFSHPISKESLSFISRIPEDMAEFMKKNGGKFYQYL